MTTNVRDKMWARPVQMQDGCWLCKITSACTFSRPKGPAQKKKFANVETFNMLVVLQRCLNTIPVVRFEIA